MLMITYRIICLVARRYIQNSANMPIHYSIYYNIIAFLFSSILKSF